MPGVEGNIHIKWLRRLEIADMPFMTREETSEYTDLRPDGKTVQFSFEMEAKSVITSPSGEMMLNGPGFHEITGLAWSGRSDHASTSRPTADAPGARPRCRRQRAAM